MATRIGSAARRLAFRRFSSGGKVLSEEEKAAENVYIKVINNKSRDFLLFTWIFFQNLFLNEVIF
jgi:hypothetical protein